MLIELTKTSNMKVIREGYGMITEGLAIASIDAPIGEAPGSLVRMSSSRANRADGLPLAQQKAMPALSRSTCFALQKFDRTI
jgi:hypothetical protein